MSLQASLLKTNPTKLKHLDSEAKAILLKIDEEINNAYKADKKSINFSVPIIFNIMYMSNKDAQRGIYYRILSSLLERQYIVKIVLTSTQSIFKISWISEEEETELNTQNMLIAKYTE